MTKCYIITGERFMKIWRILLMQLAFSAFSGLSDATAAVIPAAWDTYLQEADKTGAGQIILVLTRAAGKSRAQLFCLEKKNGQWQRPLRPMSASVGRHGIADPEMKCEGDGCSPYGIYPVSLAFGYDAICNTRMPYRQVFADDIWVDDPAAPDYNRMVKKTATTAKSFEYMRRRDELYRKGLVVEYNTAPIIPDKGSAIFIHFWGKAFNPTAGCLGLPKHHLNAVLEFLDPEKSPVIGFFRLDLR